MLPACELLLGHAPDADRLDDALLVAETCLKLDPNDGQVSGLARSLREYKQQVSPARPRA